MNGNPAKIALAGESAGGNLAVATALLAKDRGAKMPVHVLSVYPVVDGDVTGASYEIYADAKPLNKPFMEWFFDRYAPDWRTDQEALPAVDPEGAGTCPACRRRRFSTPKSTRSPRTGRKLAVALKKAGVPTEQRTYQGVTHEFFGMAAVLEQAEAAQQFAADRLKGRVPQLTRRVSEGPVGQGPPEGPRRCAASLADASGW